MKPSIDTPSRSALQPMIQPSRRPGARALTLALALLLGACGSLQKVADESGTTPTPANAPPAFDVALNKTKPATPAGSVASKATPLSATVTAPAPAPPAGTVPKSAASGAASPASATPPGATSEKPASGNAVVDKGDPKQRFAEALQLMKAKQNPEALAAFKALTEDFPNYSAPYTDLGILYARSKQRDPALAAFKQALASDPKNAIAATWLGTLSREAGDYAQAEKYYVGAITARPDYAAAHFNLAVLYDQYLNRYASALAEYAAYLKLMPGEDLRVQAWMKALESKVAGTGPASANLTVLPERKP